MHCRLIGTDWRLPSASKARSCICRGRWIQLQVLHSILAEWQQWSVLHWRRVNWLKNQRVGLRPCWSSSVVLPSADVLAGVQTGL